MPFDPDNPPDKVRKLSPKKQRQWVQVFNSCYAKHKDDVKCHKMAWGVVGAGKKSFISEELISVAKQIAGYEPEIYRLLGREIKHFMKEDVV